MNINRNNYEAYLIDYLEGKLSRQDEETVQQFLAVNPDISGEFNDLKLSDNPVEEVTDSLNKSALYKSFNDLASITPENFEEFCIAYHEGDLENDLKQRLIDYIDNHPELKPLFELHSKIRVQANTSLHFPGKKELKKVQAIPLRKTLYRISAGVAAAAVFLLWFSLSESHKFIPGEGNPTSQSNTPEQAEEIQSVPEPKITQGKEQNDIQPEYKQLATIDTTNTRQLDKIVIAELKPRDIRLKNEVTLSAPRNYLSQSNAVPTGFIPRNRSEETVLTENNPGNAVLQRKILFSALNIGVKGFNTLTESQLALQTSQDEQGRLTGIAIDANNFGFIKRIQQNNQN